MDLITTDGIERHGFIIVKLNYNINLNLYKYTQLLNYIDIFINKYSSEFVLIIDFKNIKLKHINIVKLKKLITYINITYPDRLKNCFCYNCSKIFKPFVKIILCILDKETREKIIFRDKPINDTVTSTLS